MYPTLICDDFFANPDSIVEYANTLTYTSGNGKWPGKRTEPLDKINPELQEQIAIKLLKMFFPEERYMYVANMTFQKITPFHEDKYHPKNRGWIHRDHDVLCGGIIYLTKNPEKDTGTSIYSSKTLSESNYTDKSEECKQKFYTNNEVADDEYNAEFKSTEDEWEETICVQNVYNRLFMFNNQQYHGVKTFGSGTNERLTLAFFFKNICTSKSPPPLYR